MSPSSSKLSDEEVVKKVVDGDHDMYGEIIIRYQEKLIRYVNRYCHDSERSQDVVQNAFIKAYSNLRGFDLKLKFSSWIYRIAHNEAVNFIKKHHREFTPSDDEWFHRLTDESGSLDDKVESTILKETMAKEIARLDLKYQEPLVLHFFEGHSYKAISDILRLPVSTVGTRIIRAKQQIANSLEQKGVSYEQ